MEHKIFNGSSDRDHQLETGVSLHREGRFDEAKAWYQKILKIHPRDPVALHLLGVLMHQTGDVDSGIELMHQAIQVKPEYVDAHNNLANAYAAVKNYALAETHYQEALRLNPVHAQAQANLGKILLEQDRLPEAEQAFRSAIITSPSYPEAHNNLGVVLKRQGHLNQAIFSYQAAIKARPDYAEAHNNLGNAKKEMGQAKEAVHHYQRAVFISPHYAEARNNLGSAFADLGNLEEARQLFQQTLELVPRHPRALENLGSVLLRQGKADEALEILQRAVEQNPLSAQAKISLGQCLDSLVPLWHTPMMNDHPRNEAFQAALKALVTPDTRVLEIGTGSGLLAMMAAECGAKHVTTCEMSPLIAGTARKIIAKNGLSDGIRVIARESTQIEIGEDLPFSADVIVSEILSSEFLGEGVLSSIEDARRRLLSPGGKLVPGKGRIMVALVGGDDLGQRVFVESVCGFDLGLFNKITSRRRFVPAWAKMDLLSEGVTAFEFDFQTTDYFPPEHKQIKIPVQSEGICYGLVQWNFMEMAQGIFFENHPSLQAAASGWSHPVYLFEAPVRVRPGQTAVFKASHDRVTPWFSLGELG